MKTERREPEARQLPKARKIKIKTGRSGAAMTGFPPHVVASVADGVFTLEFSMEFA